MAEAHHLRISDQDREQAAAAIREHFAAGRLDSAEFEERLQAIYAARTRGEPNALSADLPSLPLSPAQTRALPRSGGVRLPAGPRRTPVAACRRF